MLDETQKFFKAWTIVLASLGYCYFISSKLPKGLPRFLSLLPVLSLYTLLPLSLSRPLPVEILSIFITWIATFKLLLYSFNQGPLSTPVSQKSIIKFIFVAAFPIKIKENQLQNKKPSKILPFNLGIKLLISLILEIVYHYSKNRVVYCCLIYLFVEVVFGVCDLLVGATFGLELDPPSDEPYLSTSLQDFWGRRWNRTISDALRHTIYKPIRLIADSLVGRKWAHFWAVMATFVVSGLMHELIYYYLTRVRPTWEVTWFFVLHGVCVILEMVVKRGLGPKWMLHWAVSGPLTVGFVMGTCVWLFLPQIMRNHVDVKATEDFIAFGKHMKEIVRLN